MLLRRITKHVNDQNWFAVGVDFAIVVVGVFIGIQVANWNEGRAEDRREREYLERLDREFEVVETRITRALDTSRIALDAITELIKAQDTGPSAFLGPNAQRATDLFPPSISSIVPATPPAAFKELVSSGNLSILDNDELRAALYEFEAISEVSRLNWQTSQADMRPLRRMLFGSTEFDLDFTPDDVGSDEAFDEDMIVLDAFYDNEDLRTALKGAYVLVANSALLSGDQKELVERIDVLIAEELAP